MPRLVLLLLALAALPAAAQPSADAVVAGWLDDQRAAAREVTLNETLVRTVDGPRRSFRIETEGTVTYAPGERPRRAIRSGRLDGERVSADDAAGVGGRLRRAFGHGGEDVSRPPPPMTEILGRAEARAVRAEALDGRRAWRVAFRLPAPARDRPPPRRRGRRGPPPGPPPGAPPDDALTAWFDRADGRLLRVRVEGQRRGGSVVRELRFQRTDGLDVPRSASARAELRQRRRLRAYVVEITSEASYRVVD